MAVLADLRWRLQTDDTDDIDNGAKAVFVADFAAAPVNRDPLTTHFVAECDGAVAGAMTVRKVEKIPAPGRLCAFWGYLTNCYVLPQNRGGGVGAALLDFVTAWARAEALELLTVWPSDRAYPFYERASFARHADPLVLKLTGD
ncbi:MAG TPA: GNAT family N-acetyltransferase [Rhizomicrobium sp.]|nr:GNAT family N-acetyltransferase [Rhizomicrobium sp.]